MRVTAFDVNDHFSALPFKVNDLRNQVDILYCKVQNCGGKIDIIIPQAYWGFVAGRRKATKTSDFGVSRREGHDSTKFYSRRLYEDKKDDASPRSADNTVPTEWVDRILCKTSEKMDELPDSCIHLAMTSPPYNVGKTYDQDLTLGEYRQLLQAVFSEVFRVLVVGGRACVNVANVGRKPYIPLHSYVVTDMLNIGFMMRGEIIWNTGSSAGSSTAWGSWQSASNPSLRDTHEYILVFSKGSFSRRAPGGQDTISKEEFLSYTKSVWEFPAESATKVGHPAPFPIELPYRCIQLYTFQGDFVLDPFCGVGSTCVAARRAGRHYLGYDTRQEYVDSAQMRISKEDMT